MSEPSQKAKQAAGDEIRNYHDLIMKGRSKPKEPEGYYVQQLLDAATAKAREELEGERFTRAHWEDRAEKAEKLLAHQPLDSARDKQPSMIRRNPNEDHRAAQQPSTPTTDDAQMLAAELNDVATSLPSDRYSQSKEIIHRARAWIKARSAPTADVPPQGRERDLLYRIGKTLMESQSTGEPINLDLIRKEIDELLYPAKQPERFA